MLDDLGIAYLSNLKVKFKYLVIDVQLFNYFLSECAEIFTDVERYIDQVSD